VNKSGTLSSHLSLKNSIVAAFSSASVNYPEIKSFTFNSFDFALHKERRQNN